MKKSKHQFTVVVPTVTEGLRGNHYVWDYGDFIVKATFWGTILKAVTIRNIRCADPLEHLCFLYHHEFLTDRNWADLISGVKESVVRALKAIQTRLPKEATEVNKLLELVNRK